MELLKKGLQLNIELPIEQYWNDLIIETEQAIRKLEPKSQDAYRLMAAKKLNKLKKNSVNHNIHAKRLTHIAYNIKQKLHTGQAMITKVVITFILHTVTTWAKLKTAHHETNL